RGVRHAAGPIQRRSGPALGAGAAALFLAVHVRAGTAFAKIWTASYAARWTDARGFARKSLGADVGNVFPLLGLPENSQGYDLSELLRVKILDAGHGEVRRELLQVSGIRSAAKIFLGAIAIREASRSRRGLPEDWPARQSASA